MDVMLPVEMEGGALPGGISSRCTYAAVLCCICGCRMSSPSPQSTCLACLAQQTDITEGISRSVVLPCCVTCGRYMHTPNRWLSCELESRELMALMLPKVRGLRKVAKVIDSNWIWREPHSRRVSLKLTVQKEILNGRASVQQALVVEGIIQNTQCDDCKKSYTPHAGWTAMVQVRQHADHKRTLLFLEQLVLKHQLASRLLNVIEKPDGLDFCFPSRQLALQFSAFCESRFPCLTKQSKQLISHDASSNTHFHKYTISVTLAPLCRDDLVYVHRKQAQTYLGGFPSFALCSRVAGAGMQLLDPFTGRTTHVSVEKYWYAPFQLLCTRKHLSSFLVLDVTPVEAPGSRGCGQAGAVSQQRQQHAHAAGGGQSRRRRRRHQMLEDGGGLAVETDDDDWEKQHLNGKNRRDGKAAAMRRKRQLSGGGGGMLSSEHRGSVCNGTYPAPASASVNGVCAAAYSVSVPDGIRDEMATAEPMETDKIKNTQPQQLAGRAKGVTGRTSQENRGLQLCEVELMRGCDVGVCDRKVVTRTHLGGALQPGDWVQGYDLRSINLAGAVDCQLDEDARAHAGGSSKQQSRRTRKRAGGAAARIHAGGRKEESSDSGEDMEVDGVNDLCRKQGGRSRTSGTAAENSDEAAAEALLISSTAGGGIHQEEEEENSLLRCVQFEVIIVKKQPLQRLCAAADGTATDGRGGSSARTARRSGCKVRPWVLQTLEKERDAGKQGGGGGGGKRAGRRRSHLETGSDADMEAFKEELEEDPEMRAQVNLWKDPRYQSDGKTGNKNAVQRSKGKAKRGKDNRRSERCDGFSAGGEGGERGTEESDRRGVSSAGKGENERESGDAEAWEDYDSDLESSLEEDETAGVKLAELLEGLTLEDGKLKGLVVQPGGAQAISEGDFAAAKQTTLPDAAGDEDDSEAGEL